MQQIKSAIIGKAWINGISNEIMPANFIMPSDIEFTANQSFLLGNLTFRTDRNLSIPVKVAKGEKLNLFANKKRDGKRDADFSVSVQLPVDQAEAIIATTKAGAQAWKEAHTT